MGKRKVVPVDNKSRPPSISTREETGAAIPLETLEAGGESLEFDEESIDPTLPPSGKT